MITSIATKRRSHVRHGRRLLLLPLAAGLALTFISATGASAAIARPLELGLADTAASAFTTAASPAQRIGCYWLPVEPFFLTKNSDKMYSQGKITSCTKPTPSACKMEVELFAANMPFHGPFAVGWSGRAGPTNHWVSCKKMTVSTNAFICRVTPAKNQFYTQLTGQVEIAGKILTGVWDSPKVSYYCFA